MTVPLVICCSENLLLGSQLINRLQDLGYRVRAAEAAQNLVALATREQPFLVVADLGCRGADVCGLISELRQGMDTKHIPILAFGPASNSSLQAKAHSAGATLVAIESGLLHQLPQLLEHVLHLE